MGSSWCWVLYCCIKVDASRGISWPGSNVNVPLCRIVFAKSRMSGRACACKYRNTASDFHRPTSWMVSLSTLPHNNAIAPPDRRLRALTSIGLKLRCGSALADTRSMVDICLLGYELVVNEPWSPSTPWPRTLRVACW